MGISKFFGLYSIIPVTMLLTVSFFVLVVVRKLDSPGLKTFGYALAVLLWIVGAVVFSSGIYFMTTGSYSNMGGMQQMMRPHMYGPTMNREIFRQRMNR